MNLKIKTKDKCSFNLGYLFNLVLDIAHIILLSKKQKSLIPRLFIQLNCPLLITILTHKRNEDQKTKK